MGAQASRLPEWTGRPRSHYQGNNQWINWFTGRVDFILKILR